MTNVSVWLDIRRANRAGKFPLRLVVAHRGKKAYAALSVELERRQWNERKAEIVNHPQKAFLNALVSSTLMKWKQALLVLPSAEADEMTAMELRSWISEHIAPERKKSNTFKEQFDGFLQTKESDSTKRIYMATWRKLRLFDARADVLTFDEMTRGYLERFFAWMATTSPSVNARNIHLRNIRAVFNWAIDNGVTTAYPFRRFKIRAEQTRKRNLQAERLREIVETRVKPWEQKYVDAFRLSFLLIGINMADLLTLPADCIRDGRIEYRRAKTHRLYSVKVEPEAAAIINKYRGEKLLLCWAENLKSYRSFYLKINPVLQRIAPGVTTYWARHSWATIAASLDIPKETIAHALGHAQTSVTDIYIEFDERKVDAANRQVIDRVFGG